VTRWSYTRRRRSAGETRADPIDLVDAQPREQPQRQHHGEEHGEAAVEHLLAAAGEALVDHELHALPDDEHHRRGQHDRDERDRDARAIREEEPKER
jgi:hypothetical protein